MDRGQCCLQEQLYHQVHTFVKKMMKVMKMVKMVRMVKMVKIIII